MSAQKAQGGSKLFLETCFITIRTSNETKDDQLLVQGFTTMPRFYFLLFCFIKFVSYHLLRCPQLSSSNIQKTLFNFCLWKERTVHFQVRPSDPHLLFPMPYLPKVHVNWMCPHFYSTIALLKNCWIYSKIAKQDSEGITALSSENPHISHF